MIFSTSNKLKGKINSSEVKGGQIAVKGDTGNGIEKIEKTDSIGERDIYTIFFTNGETTNFDVINGKNGIDGINGINGKNGKSLEFNWQGTSLGIRLEGNQDYIYINLKGEKGEKGDIGEKGNPGDVSIEQLEEVKNEFQNKKLKIKGKTIQEGEASPDSPKEIKNAVTGINIFDGEMELGSINSATDGSNRETTTTIRSKNYIKVIPKSIITISRFNSSNDLWFTAYDKNKNYIANSYNVIGKLNAGILTKTFTVPNNCYYLRFYDVSNTNINSKYKIEYSTVATEYTPYNYGLINFKATKDTDEKNISIISKRLHQDDYIDEKGIHYKRNTIILNGTENWVKSSTKNYYSLSNYINIIANIFNANVDGNGNRVFCNMFQVTKTPPWAWSAVAGNVLTIDGAGTICIFKENGGTLDEFKNSLANNNVQIEYKVEEEIELFDSKNQAKWDELCRLALVENYTIECIDEVKEDIEINDVKDNEVIIEIKSRLNKVNNISQKNIISATINNSYTLTSANTESLILKNTINIGNKLSVINGNIVVGKEVNYVKISAQLYFNKIVAGRKNIQILKNNNIISTFAQNLTENYTGVNIAERIFKVAEGDIISLAVKGAINDIIFNADTATYITVEVVS